MTGLLDGAKVRLCTRNDLGDWLSLRKSLWPDLTDDENRRDVEQILADNERNAVFLCESAAEQPLGFIEVRLREYAEGCNTSPVGFIEGWYVVPEARRAGVGRDLVKEAEYWARSKGCTEMASDAEVENALSRQAHARLGYQEVVEIVCFRKRLE